MKKQYRSLQLLLLTAIIVTGLPAYAQLEFTHTLVTSPANLTSSRALINLPNLNGVPGAIIVATPTPATKSANPHPLGAWYYSGKWNLFNSDHAVLPVGLTYNITYYLAPATNQFLHLVTAQNSGSDGSYIDHPSLNNNPNAQFSFLQNHAPDNRPGSVLNAHEEKVGYNTAVAKWYITNINLQPLKPGGAYNIVIPTAGTGGTGSTTNPPGGAACNCPASLPPSGKAGGDLGGAYPNPSVLKLFGNPLSPTSPQPGQVLKWNGTSWEPATDNVSSTAPSTPAALIQTFFKNKNTNIAVVPQGGILPLTDLTHTISLTKKSRLVISAMIGTAGDDCFSCNTNSTGSFILNVDGNMKLELNIDVTAKTLNTVTLSNFMIDLNPGSHSILFQVKHVAGTSKLSAVARHSSVMVIPLE